MKRAAADSYTVRRGVHDPVFQLYLKRTMDLSLTVVGLVMIAPLLLAIAFLVAVTSPGPVLFRQRRIGGRLVVRDGQPTWESFTFTMYKFRSMVQDAPEVSHRTYVEAFIRGDENAMATQDPGGKMFKLQHDPRLTRVGALLRKSSLDELPQLLNVLRGEMSLVGPRPALEYEVQHYEKWHMRRFESLSGITGWWQVIGRSRVSFDRMVALDLEYIQRRSIVMDLKILFMTVGAVFRGAA